MTSATAYLVLMTLWIYALVDRTTADWTAWLLPVLALVQVAVGLAVGRWGAVLLPLLLVPISVPAKDPPIAPDNAEPFPIFVSVAFAAIFAVPLVAVGLAAREIYDRRTRAHSAACGGNVRG